MYVIRYKKSDLSMNVIIIVSLISLIFRLIFVKCYWHEFKWDLILWGTGIQCLTLFLAWLVLRYKTFRGKRQADKVNELYSKQQGISYEN